MPNSLESATWQLLGLLGIMAVLVAVTRALALALLPLSLPYLSIYLPYLSPISPLHLPYLSPISRPSSLIRPAPTASTTTQPSAWPSARPRPYP